MLAKVCEYKYKFNENRQFLVYKQKHMNTQYSSVKHNRRTASEKMLVEVHHVNTVNYKQYKRSFRWGYHRKLKMLVEVYKNKQNTVVEVYDDVINEE